MKKSDVLFLIIGTNPMPNIISIVNRVKEDGIVFLIHSQKSDNGFGTDKISNELIKLFKEKFSEMKLESIVVDKLSEDSMKREVNNRLEKYNFNNQSNKVIELNYTGGTKLMSSTIYSYFKKKIRDGNSNIILSYLDCEKDIFVYENLVDNKINITEEKNKDINLSKIFLLKDIIKSHGLNKSDGKSKSKYPNVAEEIFIKFQLLNIEEKNNWLREANEIYADYSKDTKSATNSLLVNFLNKYTNNSEVKEIESLNVKKAIDYVFGQSLEEYLFRVLTSFKEDKIIDDFVWSYESKKSEGMANIEVDFVVIKDTKIFLLSVTLCEEESESKLKLFEAKTRAEQLAGDETRIGFVCLYNSVNELRELLDENNEYSKNLVIGIENFNNIQEQFEKWFRGNR